MKTQLQMYREAEQRLFDANSAFLELVNHPTDLERAIARWPERWERFSGFLGKLKDES